MTYDEATALVFREGFSAEGSVILQLRMLDEPGAGQVAEIARALEVIRARLKGRAEIDGRLAYALFSLAFFLQIQHDGWVAHRRERAPGFDEAVAGIYERVEAVFLAVAGKPPRFD